MKKGCMACGGSMKKGGTKKPVMRGGGKVATKATASFPSVSTATGVGAKTKKKYAAGGSTECGPGGRCKEGTYNKGRGTGATKAGIGQKFKNFFNPGKIKLQ